MSHSDSIYGLLEYEIVWGFCELCSFFLNKKKYLFYWFISSQALNHLMFYISIHSSELELN